MTTEAARKEETGQQEQPKADPKDPGKGKLFSQQEFNSAMSKQQKATAAEQKRAADAEAKVLALEGQIIELADQVETLRMAGADEDDIAKATEIRKRERAVEAKLKEAADRMRLAESVSREAKLHLMANQYGVPEEALEGAETPDKMEIAALKWAMAHPKEAAKSQQEEDDMKPSKPLETGEGRSSRVAIPDPLTDKKGFEEYYDRIKKAGRAR